MKIMIDTNVVLDVYLNREPFTEISAKILKLSEASTVQGFITANTVTDIYCVIGKYLKDREKLTSAIIKLIGIVKVTDVLGSDISKAFKLQMNDYEDALIVQCAVRTKMDYIITRNPKDFENSPVPIMSPQDFLDKFF